MRSRRQPRAEIHRLAGLIDSQAAELETMDAEHSAGVSRGYELDGQIREAGSRANSSAVELERITARQGSNTDRIADLEQRMMTANDDLASARGQLETLSFEREQHRSFLENATAESNASREEAQAKQSAGARGDAQCPCGRSHGRESAPRRDAVDAACSAGEQRDRSG